MKKIYYGLLSFFFAGLVSCAKDEPQSSLEGRIDVKVSADQTLSGEMSRSGEGASVPDIGDFGLTIESLDGKVFNSWERFSEFRPVSVTVGTYTVTASYGDVEAEGFDAVSYQGSMNVEVRKEETAEASVTCFINKAKVSIIYTDEFKSYFTSYSAYVSSSKGNKVTFPAGESRGAYFVPGDLGVYLEVTRQGVTQGVTLNPKNFTAEARHEYRLTMDVDASAASLKITFNDNPSSEQNVEINISDEALNAEPPVFTPYGFVSGEKVEVLEGDAFSEKLEAYLNAPAGLAKCELVTSSASLKEQGWPESVDLMNLTAEQSQKMTALGLQTKGLGINHDKIALIDFQRLVSKLSCTSENDEVHTFTLRATDALTKVSEELELVIETRNNGFAMDLPEAVPYASTSASFTLTLEGDVSKVKFYYDLSGTGVYQPFDTEKVQVTSDNTKHTVTLTFPASLTDTEHDVRLKAEYGVKVVEKSFKIEDPELTLSLKNGDADVWAKHVDFQVASTTTDDGWIAAADNVEILSLENNEWKNVEFSYDNGQFTVSGLTSNKDYTFRVIDKNDATRGSAFVNIHTEEELPVPNGGMEDWYYTRPSGVEYWEVWYACKEGEQPVWNTMNQLTTSEGGTTKFNGFNYSKLSAYRYNANSGTVRTDGKDGGYAAQIRAVGWGQGNNAVNSANAKKATVGELYIGYYDSNTQKAVYDGIEFASRPTSLTFDYKYTPGKGGDQYYAEIFILNKQGGDVIQIGHGLSRESNSVNEWTSKTVDIEYTSEGKKMKATHMYIVFKSGDKAGNDYFNKVPGFGNLSDGEYVGSEFFVDNIVLNYE